MAAPVIPIKLLREIQNLRKDLDYMYRRYYRLSHPAVLKTSRKLDRKIFEYQELWKASNVTQAQPRHYRSIEGI